MVPVLTAPTEVSGCKSPGMPHFYAFFFSLQKTSFTLVYSVWSQKGGDCRVIERSVPLVYLQVCRE